MTAMLLVGVLVGAAIGCVVGFLLARSQSATTIGRLRESLANERSVATERLAMASAERIRDDSVVDLVRPVRESLDAIAESMRRADRDRLTSTAEMATQLRTMNEASLLLGQHTHRLANALHRSGVRGRWGEITLRRLVEAAGLLEQVHFVEQPTIRDQGVTLRPDMVINMTEGRHIVVDSKVSIDALLDEANGDGGSGPTTAETWRRHAAAFRTHIDTLAHKNYWSQFENAPEFVVMFVPAESMLGAALEADPALLERGFTKNVVIATPATLMALLRTVALGWRGAAITMNAHEIQVLGAELLSRLQSLTGHFSRLGAQLDNAVSSYNKAIGSWESRVLVTARKMGDLSGQRETSMSGLAVDVVLPIERCTRRFSDRAGDELAAERPA